MKLSEVLPLLEGRKNPSQNVKIGAYNELLKYADNPNIFISFTLLEKVGINPLSEHDTPLGIYCYPLKKGLEFYKVHNTKKMNKFPYASTQPYIQVLEWNGKEKFIHDIGKDYTDDDLNKDIEKIKQLFPNKLFNPSITSIEDLTMDIKMASKQAYDPTNPASVFFSICAKITMVNQKIISHRISPSKGKKYTKQFEVSQAARNWNKLLRLLGYSGMQDNGDGIIHDNEPCQSFFLSSDAFTHITTVKNINIWEESDLMDAINKNDVNGILDFLNGRKQPYILTKYPQILAINFYTVGIGRLRDLCELLNTKLTDFSFFHTLLKTDYNHVYDYYMYTDLVEPSLENIAMLHNAIVSQSNDKKRANDVLMHIASKTPVWQSFVTKYLQE
jgi:hypothetical protein